MKLSRSILSVIIGGVGVVALTLSGCSTTTTTLYPQSNGKFQVVSLSRAQGSGVSSAMRKAQQVCQAQGKHAVILKHTSRYQGTDKQVGEISEVASTIASDVTGNFIPSLKQNNDYKSVLLFRCK